MTFHAHPDDEAIATGGTMVLAAAAGHRVVIVIATNGDVGVVAEGVLDHGEQLADRRIAETHEAARILGADRVAFLGYRDSGMMGEPANDHPDSFWRADVEEAANRLAALLREERADVVTVYDERGGYGHPDHIQVHRVGRRAADLAQVPRVYEATLNRDRMRELLDTARTEGRDIGPEDADGVSVEELGTPDSEITTAIEVGAVLDQKRAAMRAHASQIDETSWFLTMPDAVFREAFGTEWYVRVRPDPTELGTREASLFGEG